MLRVSERVDASLDQQRAEASSLAEGDIGVEAVADHQTARWHEVRKAVEQNVDEDARWLADHGRTPGRTTLDGRNDGACTGQQMVMAWEGGVVVGGHEQRLCAQSRASE